MNVGILKDTKSKLTSKMIRNMRELIIVMSVLWFEPTLLTYYLKLSFNLVKNVVLEVCVCVFFQVQYILSI